MSRFQDEVLPPGLLAARPAPGSEGRLYFATDNATLYRDTGVAWETYAGGGTHDILSATHSDADPQAVTRGSLIYGDATPEWSELVIGAAARVLTVNAGGTEPEWAVSAAGAVALISETILGAPAASVTFAAIPGIYRTLMLFAQIRSVIAAEVDTVFWRANADAGTNYDYAFDIGRGDNFHLSGAGIGQTSAWLAYAEGNTARASNFCPIVAYWHGYALADREKWCSATPVIRFGNASGAADLVVGDFGGRWRSTAAITSLFISEASNFQTGSRFALYGIT